MIQAAAQAAQAAEAAEAANKRRRQDKSKAGAWTRASGRCNAKAKRGQAPLASMKKTYT